MKKIVRPLLEWYAENKRVLPWRENTDAYRIWVSEIMLQQTRVEAVQEYYVRFLKRFPDIKTLAAAQEDELLKYWEGLGYYSRARNLHKTAKCVCAEYGGIFPSDLKVIRSLPGIGEYTAGAIASIAFEQPVPAVDGNVLRVISRLTRDERCTDDAAVKKDITQKLAEVYPETHRGDFTQSLMELGATICLPNGKPRCAECPVSSLCSAHLCGDELSYPVRKEKPARRIEEKTVLLLCCQDRIAVRKRTQKGVLSGMWELPNYDGALSLQEVASVLSAEGICKEISEKPVKKKHIFTHIEWHMTLYRVICDKMSEQYFWVTEEQLAEEIALPTAFKKFLK